MQQFPSYWTLNDKVDFLQRKILLNSVAEKQLDIHLLDDEFKNDILHHPEWEVKCINYGLLKNQLLGDK